MKKTLLALCVSSILVGCGSDSDSSTDTPTNPPSNGQVIALFMDVQPVMGADYNCDTGDTGSTSELGQFTVTEGAICDFELDGYAIGSNREGITSKNNQITAYSLDAQTDQRVATLNTVAPTPEQYAANISALLQSIDVIQTDDKLDTSDVVGESLIEAEPLAAIDDMTFEAALITVEVEVEVDGKPTVVPLPTENIKAPSEAKDDLNNQYTSENIAQIVLDLQDLLTGNITTVDIEAKLNEYRTLLESSDSSNGYHQKAFDAILEIAEIANMEEVAARVDITGSDYSEMLSTVIESSFTPDVIIELIETPIGTTEDVSKILTEAANRLVHASERLAAAMPGEGYVLPYSEESDEALTYQDSLVIRTAALGAANVLYTLSAYSAGDDTYYLPQSETFKDIDAVNETYTWNENPPISWDDVQLDIDAEFDLYSYDPSGYYADSSLFSYRKNAAQLLTSAKSALTNAVTVSKLINLSSFVDEEDVEEIAKIISDLDNHLDNPSSSLSIDEDGELTYINLHAFYNTQTGIDSSDFNITTNSYTCDTSDLGNNQAQYDIALSKIFSEPTCSHQANYKMIDLWGNEYTNWDVIKVINNTYTEDSSITTFIPAVDADFEVNITESNNSTILDVVWCGIDEDTEEKVSCVEE
ncbi:hypothetical protein PE36_20410 [Moritella sp. PE36]|uniref:hypothetical protein n=1 Tax=Moritella sp. PE36 TaxID=58051 RepID=UPI0001568946|nr:hypothetical protein [Moritella sp. PE36]EDM69005.1 hypothetical protein PE36_20410 [Moritella sp. PE36]